MLRYTRGMDTIVKTRPAKQNTINERQDLRAWIAQLRAFGELQDIAGAEREKIIVLLGASAGGDRFIS